MSRKYILLTPLLIFGVAFFLLPGVRLIGFSLENSAEAYQLILQEPRYWKSLLSTVVLSIVVTFFTLLIGVVAGLFLSRNHFPGSSLMISLLTFPLAFPGVVVGFMVIMLGGRQGLLAEASLLMTGNRWTFAYSMTGLFVGYVYFSIPRVLLTVMSAARKLDPALPEAARSLGASPWQVMKDVTLPALAPALTATAAICFATSMGAFGTAFTLATRINVLPMTIYTEFTLNANFAMAAALSVILGLITWLMLFLARTRSSSVNVHI